MKFQPMKDLPVFSNKLQADDALKLIFEMQEKFNIKFIDRKKLNKQERLLWTMKFKTAMDCEMAELMEQLQYKWWKQYVGQDVDFIEAKYEIVDMFHFLVSIALLWGMDAEEFFAIYQSKMTENINRQKRNY